MKQNYKRADEISLKIKDLNALYQKFFECTTLITKVDDLAKKNQPLAESVKDFHPQLKGKYDGLERKLTSRPDGLFNKINGSRVLTTATDVLTETEEKSVSAALTSLDEASKLLNEFLNTDWPAYQTSLSNKQVSVEAVIK